jgi:hypothetical protein
MTGSALVLVSGVLATGRIGQVTVWGKIVPNPGTTWINDNPNPGTTWINDNPNPGTTWTKIAA